MKEGAAVGGGSGGGRGGAAGGGCHALGGGEGAVLCQGDDGTAQAGGKASSQEREPHVMLMSLKAGEPL
jgi:hypothetical protein